MSVRLLAAFICMISVLPGLPGPVKLFTLCCNSVLAFFFFFWKWALYMSSEILNFIPLVLVTPNK